MATGDQLDILKRVKAILPRGWFPESGANTGTASSLTPVLDAILSGLAAVGAWGYQLLQFAKAQTRRSTSTGGWIDISATDLFGSKLPRRAGERDADYIARIKANLFLPANTKAAVQARISAVSGSSAWVIEPFQPSDNFVWGRSFWGVDNALNPGHWANGNQRDAVLIQCALPPLAGAGDPRMGWGNFFWGNGPTNAVALGSWWRGNYPGATAAQQVYDAINAVRAVGIRVFVKFVSPAQLPTLIVSDDGSYILDDSGRKIST